MYLYLDYYGIVLVRKNMPKQIWTIGMFRFYVELFHLLFYKYFNGVGITADGGGSITTDVFWWQQFIIPDVWIWAVPKRIYTQRPSIICQGKLKL